MPRLHTASRITSAIDTTGLFARTFCFAFHVYQNAHKLNAPTIKRYKIQTSDSVFAATDRGVSRSW